MKQLSKIILLAISLLVSLYSYCQSLPSSFTKSYSDAKTNRQKGEKIINYIGNNNDSLKDKCLILLNYFDEREDVTGADYTKLFLNMLQNNTGDFTNTLKESFDVLKRFEKSNDEYGKMWAFITIANSFAVSKNYDKAIVYYKKELEAAKLLNDSVRYINTVNDIGYTYALANLPDSGIAYAKLAVSLSYQYNFKYFLAYSMSTLGENYLANKEYDSALSVIRKSYAYLQNDAFGTAGVLNDLIKCFIAINNKDSVLHYAQVAIDISKKNEFKDELVKTYENLYKFFDKINNADSSNKYFRLATVIKDSIYNIEKIKAVQDVAFNQQLRQQQEASDQKALSNRIKLYSLLAALIVFLIIVIILYRNNQQKQKANIKIENAYSELKSTQAQLIQSEKMASLGELTAGIAHEIQNPLNFVNNFSDVNKELLEELKAEADKGNNDEVKIIADDIIANEEKINHHGKRADSIVKGMLQHSRQTKGVKEPTAINALCDEYLRLSYHGLRAKDKSFNADPIAIGIKTDFDETIGKINIVPQDIGRVLLNLFNNAFYAVNVKVKQQAKGYQPMISVNTKKNSSIIELTIKDNGNGIPLNIVDKIFQPFFTTKPTGEGTGLGLSLSYDIIKAHGGEIKAESNEGEGSTFIIMLPLIS